MNDAYDSVLSRGSIRRFTDEPVSEEMIEMIVRAGLQAPSSKHSQPWYLVVDTGHRRDLLADAMETENQEKPYVWSPSHPEKGVLYPKSTHLESARMMREAPLAIQVFSDHPYTGGIETLLENRQDPAFRRSLNAFAGEVAGLSACVSQILLASHALGLGAVWNSDPVGIAWKVKEIYGQPERDYFTTVNIGFPNEKPIQRSRKRKVERLTD